MRVHLGGITWNTWQAAETETGTERRLDGDVAHLGRQHAGGVFHRVGHFAKHLAGSSSSGLYHRARAAPVKAARRRRGQAVPSGVVARR
jgi:hypothetical protein